MTRRREIYQEPQYVDPGMVNVPLNIQMHDPNVIAMWDKSMSMAQGRVDEASDILSKYYGDAESIPVRADDMEAVARSVEGFRTDTHDKVKGAYGDNLQLIKSNVAKARGTLNKAAMSFAQEQEERKRYKDLVGQGKAPQQYIPGRGMQTMSFEEYYKDVGSSFNKDGKYVGIQYGGLRGRGEHDKWSMENVSKPLMQQIIEQDPEIMRQLGPAFEGMYRSVTTGGMSDAEVEHYFTNVGSGKKDELMGDVLTNTFLNNSTFAKEEFTGPDGKVDFAAAKDYLKDLVKAQTVRRRQQQLGNLPQQKEGGGEDPFAVNPYDSKGNPIDSKAKVEKIKSNFEKFRKNEQYIGDASAILKKRAELERKLDALVSTLSSQGVVDINGVLRQINTNINSNENQAILEMYKEFYPEDNNVNTLSNGKFNIVSGKIGVVAKKLSDLVNPENNVFKNVDKQMEEMNQYFAENHAFLNSEFQQGKLKKQDMINIAEEEETAKAKTFDKNYILKQPRSKEYLETQLKSSTSIMPAKRITAKGVVEEADSSISEILNEKGRTVETIDVNPLTGLDVVTVKDGKKETYRVLPEETTTGIGNVLDDISNVLNNFYSSPEKRSELILKDGRKFIVDRELQGNKIVKRLGLELDDKIIAVNPNQFVNFMLDNLETIGGEKVEQKTKRP